MRIADVMLTSAHYVVTGQTVENAAKRIFTHGLTMLPVCRREGSVVGVITAHEIVKAVAQSRAAELCTVDEIMSSQFSACSAEDDIDEVYARMLTGGLESMLVTGPARKLAGVVDRGRLAAASRPLRAPARRLRRAAGA
jgi:predicted transcriptional regulator